MELQENTELRLMNSVPTQTDPCLAKIAAAMAVASGKWTGCNWPTRFAISQLDLNGLRPSQAHLMARATAGREAADWRAAAEWLEQLEKDARQAETEAYIAVSLARDGQFHEASRHASQACAIEVRYRPSSTWQPLRDAIEAALSDGDGKSRGDSQLDK